MRFPWQRRKPDPPTSSQDAEEAARARQRAEEDLQRTVEQTAEVRELAEKLRRHRRINHFAELFGQTFEGGPR